MSIRKLKYGRRSFIKSSALAGGGLMLGFNWMAALDANASKASQMPDDWFEINSFLKINTEGVVTIMAPNPEFGQGVKTSLPMLVAEELDVNWEKVVVEQAHFDPQLYGRQFTGGSNAIRNAWQGLRTTGATARQMLKEAAAKEWGVSVDEITTESGVLYHNGSGKSAGYGEMASAAVDIPVPEEVELKDASDFSIIGTSRKNVDGLDIVTGKPSFSSDKTEEGMLYAMIVFPPAFGMRMKSFDPARALSMTGIKDVFSFKSFKDDFARSMFDTNAFPEVIAIVGNSTWEVMQAKESLRVEWEEAPDTEYIMQGWRGAQTVVVPAGLESTSDHVAKMKEAAAQPGTEARRDGNPEEAFQNAAKVIERTYTAPFLSHSILEPITFLANFKDNKLSVAGPMQSPDSVRSALAARLDLPNENISLELTRMGGGFGRHFYAHGAVEASVISQKVNAPVKLIYTREDTTRFGPFRPAYHAVYRAALDEQNNLIAFHVKSGGIPESALSANTFPAGAVDNFLAESWSVPSNITIGWFRAPGANFQGAVEQSFMDEVAELAGKDPIEFRLELLNRAKENPVGDRLSYDADRYATVLEQVREKSGWGKETEDKKRGVAAYFCHNGYVANVIDIEMEDGRPRVENVCSVVDCGIVVNPGAAENMVQGNIVDAIGHAMYGEMTFRNGEVDYDNFGSGYRLIRHSEAPKKIDVNFVDNGMSPSGLGEPPFPPTFAALANALYSATGERYYHQPFINNSFG